MKHPASVNKLPSDSGEEWMECHTDISTIRFKYRDDQDVSEVFFKFKSQGGFEDNVYATRQAASCPPDVCDIFNTYPNGSDYTHSGAAMIAPAPGVGLAEDLGVEDAMIHPEVFYYDGEDTYSVRELSQAFDMSTLDGTWIITEDHYWSDQRKLGNEAVFSFSAKTWSTMPMTITGCYTWTSASDLTCHCEYNPSTDQIKGWYDQPDTNYFYYSRKPADIDPRCHGSRD